MLQGTLALPKLSERYAENPHKWNLSIVLAAGAILWAGLLMTVQIHSASETSHPAITSQLQDIRADQIKTQIMAMDKLICEQPSNNYYREELIRLITVWEGLTEQKFPTQLLRCGK